MNTELCKITFGCLCIYRENKIAPNLKTKTRIEYNSISHIFDPSVRLYKRGKYLNYRRNMSKIRNQLDRKLNKKLYEKVFMRHGYVMMNELYTMKWQYKIKYRVDMYVDLLVVCHHAALINQMYILENQMDKTQLKWRTNHLRWQWNDKYVLTTQNIFIYKLHMDLTLCAI